MSLPRPLPDSPEYDVRADGLPHERRSGDRDRECDREREVDRDWLRRLLRLPRLRGDRERASRWRARRVTAQSCNGMDVL